MRETGLSRGRRWTAVELLQRSCGDLESWSGHLDVSWIGQETRLYMLFLTSHWIWATLAGSITLDDVALLTEGNSQGRIHLSAISTHSWNRGRSTSILKEGIWVMHYQTDCRRASLLSCLIPQFSYGFLFFYMKIILCFSSQFFTPLSLRLQIFTVRAPWLKCDFMKSWTEDTFIHLFLRSFVSAFVHSIKIFIEHLLLCQALF